MGVRLFRKQFIPKILDGTKIHTCRIAKRMDQIGDILFCKKSNSENTFFAVLQIVRVEPIHIKAFELGRKNDYGITLWINNVMINDPTEFIKNEGFDSEKEIFEFFKNKLKLESNLLYNNNLIMEFEGFCSFWKHTKDY